MRITIYSNEYLKRIYIPCKVKNVFNEKWREVKGVIDIGATCTCITKRLAKQLKCKPFSESKIEYALGKSKSKVHIIDFIMADTILMSDVSVFAFPVNIEADIIIGMDILSRGNLALRNIKGITSFSFSISKKEVMKINKDKEHETINIVKRFCEEKQ